MHLDTGYHGPPHRSRPLCDRPGSHHPDAAPATLRSDVGAAVGRAWDRAVAAGALPAWPDEAVRPAIEIERPADAVHGDFASNLAMKLARPYRMAPLAIGAALAAELVAEAEADPAGTPVATAEVAAARVPQPAASRRRARVDDRRDPRRPAAPGAGSPADRHGPSTSSSCRPTRPARCTSGTHAGRSSATCSAVSSRRAVSGSRASTTSTTRAARSGTWARRWPRSSAANPSPTTATRPTTSSISRRNCPPMCGTPPRPRTPTPTASSGTGPPDASAKASRPASPALGVRFDVWTSEARLHEEGWVERAVERLRERGHVYEQDGATWFRSTDFGDDKDRVIFRSNGEPTYFAADIGYVTEKFSRGFDHLIYVWGADHHGTVARVRNAAEAMGYDRRGGPDPALFVGPLRARRRGSLDEQARRRVHHPRRVARRGRRRCRALVLRLTVADDRDRLRHRAGQEAVEREPRLLRPVRARPDRVDPAQGRRDWAGAGDRCDGVPRRARPRRRSPARSPAFRRSSRTPSRPRRPRASPPTRPSWRPRSTASTATRGWSTPMRRSARRRGWPSPTRRGSRWRTP